MPTVSHPTVDIGGRTRSWTGTWFSGGFTGPVSNSSTDIKIGDSVPHWKDKIRRVTSATGTYSRVKVVQGLVRGVGSFSINNPNQGNQLQTMTCSGVLLQNPKPVAPAGLPVNSVDTLARMAFMKKVRKSQRSFQGGVFLGELREAIHMVVRPASGLRNAIDDYVKAQRSAFGHRRNLPAKALTDTWLEHSFGWRPFLSDVDSGMKALAKVPRIIGDPISGVAKDAFKSAPFTQGEVIDNGRIDHTWVDESSVFVKYKGLVAYENENSAPDWQSNWGITLSDFLPTVWELIPYSFLVDYFTNIGDIIDGASMGSVQLRWGFCSTLRKSSRRNVSYSWGNQGYPASWHFSPNNLTLQVPELSQFSFVRQNISSVSVGITDFQMKIPGIGDWRKWANIGALATSRRLVN